ncbi:hypothetical protein [Desulfobacula phenolica]|uniref:hypothetical protein n=1 Tax=Desulfobacula phenolica TaxID=90732 RepID=UPI00111330D0|nr:hypothetical protein [Desulfobacula phenolica]
MKGYLQYFAISFFSGGCAWVWAMDTKITIRTEHLVFKTGVKVLSLFLLIFWIRQNLLADKIFFPLCST